MSDEVLFFCENVKKLREIEKISKTKMAKKLEISVYQLSKIENGILPPQLDISIVVKISKLYKIEPSRLFKKDFVKTKQFF